MQIQIDAYLGEFLIAILALVRLASFVQLYVVVQMPRLSELLMTNWTLERLLAIV